MERQVFWNEKLVGETGVGIADTHVHTAVSRHDDGKFTARTLGEKLQENVVDVVCITPHNDFDATERVVNELSESGFEDRVVPGLEVTTLYRDGNSDSREVHLIGLYLKEAVPDYRDTLTTVEEILKQDGVVVIPHPGNGDKRVASMKFPEIERLMHEFPGTRFGIEIYSASIRDAGNKFIKPVSGINDTNSEAREFYKAHKHRLAPTGGTDAHFLALGFGVTRFKGFKAMDLRRGLDKGNVGVANVDRMQSRNPRDHAVHKIVEWWRDGNEVLYNP